MFRIWMNLARLGENQKPENTENLTEIYAYISVHDTKNKQNKPNKDQARQILKCNLTKSRLVCGAILSEKEDEKPGVIGDGDADSCTTRHWHFAEVKFLLFSSDGGYLYFGNPFYLFMHVAGKGGVLEVWQLDTYKKFLPRIRTRLLRYLVQIIEFIFLKCHQWKSYGQFQGLSLFDDHESSESAYLYSSDDHWHLVWEELIYITLRLFAVNVRLRSFTQRNQLSARLQDQMLAHLCLKFRTDTDGLQQKESQFPSKSHSVKHISFSFLLASRQGLLVSWWVLDMKAEYFPPKEDVILQNEAPTDFYVLVTGAVELVVTRNGVEHANVGDGTIIMNNLLQELMETENMLARGRLDLPLSLCFAMLRKDDLFLHKLLKRGLDANESDNNGRIDLLDFGADPNSRGDERTRIYMKMINFVVRLRTE
ncbi:potassium channel AKT1-like protein [Tanacetum coccineum]